MDLLIQSKAIKIYFFTAIILKKKIYLIKNKNCANLIYERE